MAVGPKRRPGPKGKYYCPVCGSLFFGPTTIAKHLERAHRNWKRSVEMSWSYNKAGRASRLAEVVKQQFAEIQGCPVGTAEEAAKNALGVVAETLCNSLADDPVIRIEANGSAWNVDGKARSQYVSFKLEMLGDFVD